MSSNDSKSISVIIPAHNVEGCLAEAIQSIHQQLSQPYEIIVVDDGSTDATGSIAHQAKGVICIEQDNQGASGARNTGIRAARGEFIAFLDADDLWLPNHTEILLQPFQLNLKLDFVWGTSLMSDISQTLSVAAELTTEKPFTGFLLGAGLFRRDVFDRVGFFDQNFKTCNDLEWFSRAKQSDACFQQIPAPVLAYRKRPGSLTADVPQMQADRMQMFRNAAARRREAIRQNASQGGAQQ